MIITRKYIRELREKSFIDISKDMEERILKEFGKNPEPGDDGCILNIQSKTSGSR